MSERLRNALYLACRRAKAALNGAAFRLVALFCPIDPRKVVFCTTEGLGGYGDHPKAIAEYLHAHHPELSLVWLTDGKNLTFPPYIQRKPYALFSRAYELATAKVWVNSHRMPWGTRKRPGQFYLQTWHGMIGFKPVGKMRGGKMPKIAELVSVADSALIDGFLSNSPWFDDVITNALYYDGEILRYGSPRCDILFDAARKKAARASIRARYGIPADANLFLYAPTFRAGSQARARSVAAENVTLDFARIQWTLEEKTHRPWRVALRLHPQVAAHLAAMPHEKVADVVDLSQYPDVYEILAASDAILSDYSSLVFDAAAARLPAFLYADDIAAWEKDRGGLLFDLRRLPFPFAETEEKLLANLRAFDKAVYEKTLAAFLQSLGMFEDGQASRRAAAWILEKTREPS